MHLEAVHRSKLRTRTLFRRSNICKNQRQFEWHSAIKIDRNYLGRIKNDWIFKSARRIWVKRNKNDHFLLFPVQRKEERKETWFSHRYLKTGSVCQKDVSIDFYGAGVNAMGECWDTLKDRNCTKVIRFGCVPLFGLFLNANFRIVLK